VQACRVDADEHVAVPDVGAVDLPELEDVR
jgi:hypothetical protein